MPNTTILLFLSGFCGPHPAHDLTRLQCEPSLHAAREAHLFDPEGSVVCVALQHDTGAQDPGARGGDRTELERTLEVALRSGKRGLVHNAINVLGSMGDSSHVPMLMPFTEAPDAEVRAAAIAALGTISMLRPGAHALAVPRILSGLRDPDERCRFSAVHSLGLLRLPDSAVLAVALQDPAPDVRLLAGSHLARLGFAIPAATVRELLSAAPGRPLEWAAADLFHLVPPSEREERLSAFRRSESYDQAYLRHRVYAACAPPLGTADPSDPSSNARAVALEEQATSTNRLAHEALYALPWHEVDPAVLAAAVARHRLVVFGEMHSTSPQLRDAQCRVMKIMLEQEDVELALGFEPSVQEPQERTIAFAKTHGVATLALEHNWAQLIAERRTGARDHMAATAINEWLGSAGARRMLVIRGEGHIAPSGYMESLLAEKPLVIMTVAQPTLGEVGDKSLVGRVFQIGKSQRVFHLAVSEPFDEMKGLRRLAEELKKK